MRLHRGLGLHTDGSKGRGQRRRYWSGHWFKQLRFRNGWWLHIWRLSYRWLQYFGWRRYFGRLRYCGRPVRGLHWRLIRGWLSYWRFRSQHWLNNCWLIV